MAYKMMPVKWKMDTRPKSKCNTVKDYNEIEKLPFDYNRCSIKDNKIVSKAKFKLDDVKEPPRDEPFVLNFKPFQEDKLLFCYNGKFVIRNQDGKIVETHPITCPKDSVPIELCLNNRYIYVACLTKDEKRSFLLKYDHSFKLIDEEEFPSPCYSLDCNEQLLFFTGEYGYRSNAHAIVYVIDCNDFRMVHNISYEVGDDRKLYCTEKLSGPPRSVVHNDRIYFCYDTDDGETHQVDYASTKTFYYLGKFSMPLYFMNYCADAAGNLVYYQHETSTFCVHDPEGKLIKKLEVEPGITNFCVTNDGYLAVLREEFEIEIY